MLNEQLCLKIDELECEKTELKKELARAKEDTSKERDESMDFRLKNKFLEERIVR